VTAAVAQGGRFEVTRVAQGSLRVGFACPEGQLETPARRAIGLERAAANRFPKHFNNYFTKPRAIELFLCCYGAATAG